MNMPLVVKSDCKSIINMFLHVRPELYPRHKEYIKFASTMTQRHKIPEGGVIAN